MSDLSVVIATYNRPELLAHLVDQLRNQTLMADLIVVDDGSSPRPDATTLARLNSYVYLSHEGYGRVRAFNTGVSLVATPYLILMDDDQLPLRRDYLYGHRQVLEEYDASQGVGLNEAGGYTLPPWFSTSNLGLRLDVALHLGPFDRAYNGRYGYEDHDLGRALGRAGYRVGLGGPETVCQHLGGPHSADVGSELAVNKDYYCQKWGIHA